MDRMIISAAGYPGSSEWLSFIENQSIEQIEGLVKTIGDNVIVSGVVDDNGTSSSGYIIFNNELLPFESSPTGATINIIETVTSAGYDTAEDDSFDEVLPVWKTRKAKFSEVADTDVVDSFQFDTLERLETLISLKNKLSIKRSGNIKLTKIAGNPIEMIVVGDFVNAELLSSDVQNIRLRLTFAEIEGDYFPFFNILNDDSTNTGLMNFAIHEQTSTTITIDIRREILYDVLNYVNNINIKLIQ
jgi:hypothetical protein